MNIREALLAPAPQQVFYRQQPIFIRHPGCDLPLLCFPALSTDSTGHYGVFRPLVLNACRVLTNHKADYNEDFLATDRQGQSRVPIDDTPLDVDCYYFLGPPEGESHSDYPIVKTFSAFTFPSTLPDDWARVADTLQRPCHGADEPPRASSASSYVRRRDARCAVTKYSDGALLQYLLVTTQLSLTYLWIASTATQRAHLIPQAEKTWFTANRMLIYAPDNPAGIDGAANGILLRADVRRCFDSHAFVIYPADDDDNGFVAYFVRRGYPDFPDLFHRRRVTVHPDVPVQYLYARFAHTIINLPRCDDSFESVRESGGKKRKHMEESEEEEGKPAKKMKTAGMAQGAQGTLGTVNEENDGG